MTHAQFMERINAITAQSIAYATEHAEEIKQRREESITNSEKLIGAILLDAKNAPKKSWTVYESFKNRISVTATSSEQYEIAIQKLTKILNV